MLLSVGADTTIPLPCIRETFEWFDVRRSASVVLTVMDYDAFTRDEVVGTVTVPIETVISTGESTSRSLQRYQRCV